MNCPSCWSLLFVDICTYLLFNDCFWHSSQNLWIIVPSDFYSNNDTQKLLKESDQSRRLSKERKLEKKQEVPFFLLVRILQRRKPQTMKRLLGARGFLSGVSSTRWKLKEHKRLEMNRYVDVLSAEIGSCSCVVRRMRNGGWCPCTICRNNGLYLRAFALGKWCGSPW